VGESSKLGAIVAGTSDWMNYMQRSKEGGAPTPSRVSKVSSMTTPGRSSALSAIQKAALERRLKRKSKADEQDNAVNNYTPKRSYGGGGTGNQTPSNPGFGRVSKATR